MTCYVRMMAKEDIPQVAEIDQEAFPTLWPPPNYRRELENRLARYVVACSDDLGTKNDKPNPVKGSPGTLTQLRQLFRRKPSKAVGEYILGFAGFWLMADEVHITNIVVREKYRRQGIGELLLISLINLAMKLGAGLVTLEVRASNTAAQALYSKYGFSKVGVRRGYYTDNHEDGILMSIEDINSASFRARLAELERAHFARWGYSCLPAD